MLIGRSTHSPAQADAARVEDGVAYYCCGPTWTTPTKPGRPAAGLALLDARGRPRRTRGRGSRSAASRSLDRLDEVIARGARRAVVVRAITEAEDPGAAAAAFAARLRAARRLTRPGARVSGKVCAPTTFEQLEPVGVRRAGDGRVDDDAQVGAGNGRARRSRCAIGPTGVDVAVLRARPVRGDVRLRPSAARTPRDSARRRVTSVAQLGVVRVAPGGRAQVRHEVVG